MAGWIVGSIVFVVCWYFLLLAALLTDEDENHWDWVDDGPGFATNLRIALLTALIAFLPAAGAWALANLLF